MLARADDAVLARALVAKNLHGHRVAWSRFSPMVRRMLYRKFGPDTDIEDLTQDVFLAMFRKIGGLRKAESLKAFVASITVRLMKRELRRRGVVRRFYRSAPPSTAEDPLFPGADHDARRSMRMLYSVLDGLSPLDNTMFVLRFCEQLDMGTIAARMNISVSTAKRRLRQVRKRVAATIEQSPELRSYLKNWPELRDER